MKIITLEMPLDRAEYLLEALYQHMDSWGSEMERDEMYALNSIYTALKGKIND